MTTETSTSSGITYHTDADGIVVRVDQGVPERGVSRAQLKPEDAERAAERHAADCRRRYDELMTRTEGYRISLADLCIDSTYQRDVERAHVERMKRTFDPLLIGTLSVSMRVSDTGEAKMYVLDGQQRLQVLSELGLGGRKVDAKVWLELTPAEEARVFLGLNSGKTISATSKLRARCAAGDEAAIEIMAAIEMAGFSVDYRNSQKLYGLSAVTSVEAIYEAAGGLRNGGRERTLDTLVLHRKLWHGRRKYEAAMIRGAGVLTIRHYGKIRQDLLAREFQPDQTMSEDSSKRALPWSPELLLSEGIGKFERQPAAGIALILSKAHDSKVKYPGKVKLGAPGAAFYLLSEVKRLRARGEC